MRRTSSKYVAPTPEEVAALDAKVAAKRLAETDRRIANSVTCEKATEDIAAYIRTQGGQLNCTKLDVRNDANVANVYAVAEITWSMGCTLYVSLDHVWDGKFEDRDGNTYIPSKLRVEVSWSSNSRTLSEAAVVTDLYRQMIALGQRIEVLFGKLDIVDLRYSKKDAAAAVVDDGGIAGAV